MNNKTHVPLVHISRRAALPWYKAWAICAAAIVLALIVCGGITALFTGEDPFALYLSMIEGAFGSSRRIWALLQSVAILLCVSLAVTPAFKMRFWNIGGEGQIMAGCLATAACMIVLRDVLPNWLLIATMLVTSIAAGGVWGLIPAFFKAKWNTNETLFTLMMNYVAIQLVAFFIIIWESPAGSGNVGIINQQSQAGWLPMIGSNRYMLNVIVVAVITVLMYVYLKYSKHGYEISVVGESERTARYVGIKVERVIMRTMFISGALCGFAGFLLVAGTDHTITTTISANRGFTAVMVSWLAKFSPVFMVFTSFLIEFLARGASEIATDFGLNEAYGDILTGIILFFIIGSEFFITYKLHFRGGRKAQKEAAENV